MHDQTTEVKMCDGRKEKKENFVTHPAQNFDSLLSVSLHQSSTFIFIYMLLLPKGQMGETSKPIQCNALSEIGDR
jgi:hypothetical protein